MIVYAAEEGSAVFHADPGWVLLVVVCGLLIVAGLVLSVLGLVHGSRRRRVPTIVFGWVGVAFALFSALMLVSFPVALAGVFAFVLFAPFVTLLAIIGLVGGILSFVFAAKREAPADA